LEAFGGSGSRKNIAALRVTLKSESDNVRDAPALDVAVYLKGLGGDVFPTDPEGIESAGAESAARVHLVDERSRARR
jgi:UDP-glucose 6-dehydrogenase